MSYAYFGKNNSLPSLCTLHKVKVDRSNESPCYEKKKNRGKKLSTGFVGGFPSPDDMQLNEARALLRAAVLAFCGVCLLIVHVRFVGPSNVMFRISLGSTWC